jgi:transposase InsO family protein
MPGVGWRRWPIGRICRACLRQVKPAVEVRLVELRGLHPGWGPDRLRYRLAREGVDPLPSRAAIGRALNRLSLVRSGRRRSRRREYRRWERGRPMELWQIDVMGGVMLADGRELKAVTIIDDHSRFCLAVGLVERATSRPVCGVFARALAQFGAPEAVLSDNGKVFTGRFASRPMEVLFDRICRENGIRHLLTAPRSPTTTGKIERFHKTIQAELLTGRVFDDLAQAQAAVDTWVAGYNTRRPHQALAMQAPAERFTQPQAAQQTPGGGGRRWRAAIGPVPHGHRLGRAAAHRAGRHRAVPRLLRRGAAQDRAPHHPQRRRPLRPTRPPRQRPGHVKHQANREGRGCRVPGP